MQEDTAPTDASDTISEEWDQSLKAICNRLQSQYLQLLRSASTMRSSAATTNSAGADGAAKTAALNSNPASTTSNPASINKGTDGDVEKVGITVDPLESRSGGSRMVSLSTPTPPLAASVQQSALSIRLSVDNIVVACTQLLSLIRALRLSLLLMDTDAMDQEQRSHIHQSQQNTTQILQRIVTLEDQLRTHYNQP